MTSQRMTRWIVGLSVTCIFLLVPRETAGANTEKRIAPPLLGVVFPVDENDDAWVTEVVEVAPAAMAGIKPGDTITKINEVSIKTVKQFREAMKDQKPGNVVKLIVRRGAKNLTFSITLGELKD